MEQVKGINVVIGADKTKFNSDMNEIRKDIAGTDKSLKALKKSLVLEWDPAKFTEAQLKAQQKIDATKQKVEMLQQRLAYLNQQPATAGVQRELQKLTPELLVAQKNVQQLEAELRKLNSMQLNQIASEIKSTGMEIRGAGQAMLPMTVAIGAGFAASAKAAMDYESAMAGVAKTTDLTKIELEELGEDIRELARDKIPKAATELAAFAEAGGQFGVANEYLREFVKTTAALDVSTNLKGTEGAQELAQFAGITQMAQENYERLGSTIVALGNNSKTSEGNIMSMALRLAGAGKQAKMSEVDIVSIAAGLASLGIEAEAGGSSMSKVILNIQTAVETGSAKLKQYADVAGMSASQFAQAFKDDAASALVAFVEGLGQAEAQGTSTVAMLSDMEITEVRMRDALLRASGAGDNFRAAIELGSKAWAENIALTKEAETRYETTASKAKLAKNELLDMAIEIGGSLLPIVEELGESVGDLSEWFSGLSEDQQKAVITALAMTAAIGPLLMGIGQITIGVGGITKAVNTLKVALANNPAGVVLAIAAAVAALAVSYGSLTAKQTEAQKANKALDKAMQESAKSAEKFGDEQAESASKIEAQNKQINQLLPRIKELNEKQDRTAQEQAELNRLIEAANGIVPGLIKHINGESGAWEVNTVAIRRNLEMRRNYDELEKNINRQIDIEKELADLTKARDEVSAQMAEIQARAQVKVDSGDYRGTMNESQGFVGMQQRIEGANAQIAVLNEEMSGLKAKADELGGSVDQAAAANDRLAASGANAGREIAQSIEDAAKAYASAVSKIKDLTSLQKQLNKAGEVTPELLAEIVDKYGDLATAGADVEAMQDGINQKIGEQSAIAAKAHMDMIASSKDTLKAQIAGMLNANQGLVNALVSLYGADASNWGKLAAGKFDTESKLVSSLASLWSQYYGRTAQSLNAEMQNAVLHGDSALAGQISSYLALSEQMKAQFEDLAKGVGGFSGGGGGGSKKDPQVEAYEKAVKDLEYLRSLDMIDTQTYYNALTGYRDQYLKVETDEWRAATKTLFDLKKQARDDELKAAETAYKAQQEAVKATYDARKKAEDERYKARVKQIEDEQEAEQKRIDALIEGIDKEIEARNRLKASENYDKNVSSLEAAIAFERDDENRIELERELARVKSEEEERLWLQSKEDERDLLEQQLARVNELAELRKEKAQEEHEQILANLETAYNTQMANLESMFEQEKARINETFELAKQGATATGKALGDATSAAMVAGINKAGETALEWIARIKAQAEASAAAAVAAAQQAAQQAISNINNSTTNNNKTANLTINNNSSALTSGQVQAVLNDMGR